MKSRLFSVNCYRGYCLASWIVTRDSSVTSSKSDYEIAGWLLGLVTVGRGWFPGLAVADCESEFYFYV